MSPEPPPSQDSSMNAWRRLAWLFSGLLAFYALLVAPLDDVLPWTLQWRGTVVLAALAALAASLLLGWLSRNPTGEREGLKAITVFSAVVLAGALGADLAYAAYANVTGTTAAGEDQIEWERGADPNLWEGELSPDLYALGRRDVVLFKPNQVRQGRTYGQFYLPGLLKHALLRDSVFEQRDIAVAIDGFGFRNTQNPSEAKVFLLGDSFVYGYHLTQKAMASSVLSARLGAPVYNLGVFATSPVQQVQLLKHLFATKPESFKPSRIFWFIFESNDLEDDYPPFGRAAPSAGSKISFEQMANRTIVRWAADFPKAIRSQSILRRISSGELGLRSPTRNLDQEARALDGQTLPAPLYRSARFGAKFFNQVYLDRARQPESYVRQHPHLPKLRAAMEEMAGIARARGILVTVVAAPSGVRMHHRDFNIEGVSDAPHFLRVVLEMAPESGLDHLDLSEALKPFASQELLYQRDDEHWNERANEIIGGLLAQRMAERPVAPGPRH